MNDINIAHDFIVPDKFYLTTFGEGIANGDISAVYPHFIGTIFLDHGVLENEIQQVCGIFGDVPIGVGRKTQLLKSVNGDITYRCRFGIGDLTAYTGIPVRYIPTATDYIIGLSDIYEIIEEPRTDKSIYFNIDAEGYFNCNVRNGTSVDILTTGIQSYLYKSYTCIITLTNDAAYFRLSDNDTTPILVGTIPCNVSDIYFSYGYIKNQTASNSIDTVLDFLAIYQNLTDNRNVEFHPFEI